MSEAVQLGAVAVEVVGVADIARARGINRATEAQKGAVFIIVASVGKEITDPELGNVMIFRKGIPEYEGLAYLS